ncbi:MAG TPA: hypothetical protein DEP66_06980 [Acidimicrobiaceae bacterium]|nr:hypothetical protein [Acidimicrobiaceae bacterium]HCB37923.1 hypothetical protein [Acidimicrobiaceae bacterium]
MAVEVKLEHTKQDPTTDARERIGKSLRSDIKGKIQAAFAVIAPKGARGWESRDVVAGLLAGRELRYRYVGQQAGSDYPQKGFITGSVRDLVDFIESAAVPAERIEHVGAEVASAIDNAAGILDGAIPDKHPDRARITQAVAADSDWSGMKVAALVWLNAFLLQNAIAAQSSGNNGIKSVDELRSETGQLSRSKVKQAWQKILVVNYKSIFHPALEALPLRADENAVKKALTLLADAAEEMAGLPEGGTTSVGGDIYAKVTTNRKSAAAYYTLPAVAEFLVRMALPDRYVPCSLGDWAQAAAQEYRMGDFACGTGTLLKAGYQRLRALVEGDADEAALSGLHEWMLGKGGIAGFDITTIAAHLTATGLAMCQADQTYDHKSNVGVLALTGKPPRTGSIELLDKKAHLYDLLRETVQTSSGTDDTKSGSSLVADNASFDLLLMNPPYSRMTGGDRKTENDKRPRMYSWLSDKDREEVEKRQKKLAGKAKEANLTAGLATVFSVIAHNKLRPGGRLALVLPMTAATGRYWRAARAMFVKHYDDLVLVFYAEGGMMSHETGMREMLLIGTKRTRPRSEHDSAPVVNVCVDRAFATTAEAREVARAVNEASPERRDAHDGDGAHKGVLRVGETVVGNWLRTRHIGSESWIAVGVSDMDLLTQVDDIARGEMCLSATNSTRKFPISTLGQQFELGGSHETIGHIKGNDPCGAFELHPLDPNDRKLRPDKFLWAGKADNTNQLTVKPDHYGEPNPNPTRAHKTMQEIRNSRADLLVRRDLRFTSQATLVVTTTPIKVIGGPAWTTLMKRKDDGEVHDLAAFGLLVWANSTLGLMSQWSQGGLQQAGRSRIPQRNLHHLPCPDFRHDDIRSSLQSLCDAERKKIMGLKLDPAMNAATDESRHYLDGLVAEMLGFDPKHIKPLRDAWVQEPSVRGTKALKGAETDESDNEDEDEQETTE